MNKMKMKVKKWYKKNEEVVILGVTLVIKVLISLVE